jgi:sigma-B regulation protein RsbU (phosphoserine phosphatase)
MRGPRRFRSKLIIVTCASLVMGLAASLGVALHSIHRLAGESSSIIREGLATSSRADLGGHIEDTAHQVDLLFRQAIAELDTAADVTQSLVDHDRELIALSRMGDATSILRDEFEFRANSRQWTTRSVEPCVTAVWGYLLDQHQQISPPVREAIRSTALADIIYPAVMRRGLDKLQVYYVGPPEAPYVRLCPWTDIVGTFDKEYPGHNEHNFWDFFFPGLLDGWSSWAAHPDLLKRLPTQATFIAPYEDAAGGGLIMSIFRPVWRRDRSFAGAVAMDLTLEQLHSFVEHVRFTGSGFAFLAQQNGNVVAVNPAGQATLGLSASSNTRAGVSLLERTLDHSTAPAVAALTLPNDDAVRSDEIEIDHKVYVVVLKRLPPFNVFMPKVGIVPEAWTLGFVVPKDEIFAPLTAAETAMDRRTREIVSSQVIIAGATLVVMLLGVLLISRRMTGALQALADAASRIMRKDYAGRVVVTSRDELGHMASAFNAMADEIQEYTRGLERLVDVRTSELRKASEDISYLNKRLEAENLRMGAELDVARRLQRMVLPQPHELRGAPDLEIAALMQSATEVGGDYYDVLPAPNGVYLGVGDVTGHGIESGVVMLMLQTAFRTLVAADERDLGRMMAVVNKVLHENIQRSQLDHSATLSLLQVTGDAIHVTGQHEEVILCRHDGVVQRVSTMGLGFPIGLVADVQPFVAASSLPFEPGDVLLLYTDGVTEAENPAAEQYGMDRLCEVLARHHGADAQGIVDAAIADITKFMGSRGILDDITLVVAKRR